MRIGLDQTTALDLSLDINLMLNPRMLQMLHVLNLPYAGLIEKISREAEENPLLELERRDSMIEYLKFHSGTPLKDPGLSGGSSGRETELEDYLKKGVDLAEHLLSQAGFLDLDEEDKEVVEELIKHVDGSGYLRERKSIIEKVMAATGAGEEAVLEGIKTLQSFEPDGVGAEDLKECLLLQIEAYAFENKGLSDLLKKAVREHIDEIAAKDLKALSSGLRVSEEAAENIIAFIKDNLNPSPGSAFSSCSTPAIPSFSVKIERGSMTVVNLESKFGPELKLSPHYLKMLKDPKTDRETVIYIKEKIDKANELLEQLEKRRQTLEKMAAEIFERQKDYLAGAAEHPAPLMQKDISEKFGVHPSTVSRALSEKYAETPRGVISLKSLCPREVYSLTSALLRNMVKDLIDKEDKSSPVSDDHISRALSEKGYDIKRRTVSQYRKKLSIASAAERKAKKK